MTADGWRYEPPTQPWLSILYSDDDIVAIDKSGGLLSVPGRAPDRQDSAQRRLDERLGAVRVVHRLDMDTSGVMIFARHRDAERALDRQLRARQIEKTYRARVSGHPVADEGVIDLPLARLSGELRSEVRYGRPGKVSRTAYTVLCRRDDGSAELQLRPQTGRSHQLRVHLLMLGHPILGDRFYAPPQVIARSSQLMLHAECLRLDHPLTHEPLVLRAPLPVVWG